MKVAGNFIEFIKRWLINNIKKRSIMKYLKAKKIVSELTTSSIHPLAQEILYIMILMALSNIMELICQILQL